MPETQENLAIQERPITASLLLLLDLSESGMVNRASPQGLLRMSPPGQSTVRTNATDTIA